MIINDVHQGIHKNKKRKRIGRGPGSGHGKMSGRGHKGDGSRSGHKTRRGFEGGQTPIFRRIAKRGFNNKAFADVVIALNISFLENFFEAGDVISPETLKERGIVKKQYDVLKILGKGELKTAFKVHAHRFSAGAQEMITQAGGTAELIVPQVVSTDA